MNNRDIYTLKDWVHNQANRNGLDIQAIDIEAEIDNSLSYAENKAHILEVYPSLEIEEKYPQYLIAMIEKEAAERQGQQYNGRNRDVWGYKGKHNKTIEGAKNPYAQTTVKQEQSIKDIYTILKAYGASDILFNPKGWVLFRISTGSKVLTIRKLLPDGIEARVGWRYIFWSCKSALEAISSNMATTEEVFLQDTVIRLSNNSYSTIGEAAKKAFLALAP